MRDTILGVHRTLFTPLVLSLAMVFTLVIFTFNVLPDYFKVPVLEQVLQEGELVVLTRNSATTYYAGPDGPAGLEYDMARMFADELGVELKMITPTTLNDVLTGLENRVGHFAAAGLTITDGRKLFFKFTPSYQDITEQLIYNSTQKRPRKIEDVIGSNIEVVANSSHVGSLLKLQEEHPELNWREDPVVESEELLQQVADGILDHTVADSNEFKLQKRFLLNLKSAFDVSEPRQLAWAFPLDEDTSLYDAASAFIERIKENGELTRLIERNYGHAENLNYVGTMVFRRHVAQRLPQYREMFEQAAAKPEVDWRLIAAIGYQESHWDPDAVSPTGVRGIMMLTQRTAAEMGIQNRLDPESSIRGGADYFVKTRKRIPQDITEPDRTWLAMAAYNVGLGHVEDARVITQERGMNPDAWLDVKQSLPLLAKKKWYKNTRYGYARGWEPVRYVENIRSYYDLLRWLDEAQYQPEPEPDAFSILPNVP